MKTKNNISSIFHTSQQKYSIRVDEGRSSLIAADRPVVGQMDIYDVLADIAAEERGA